MKVFLVILLATILEAAGDALVRVALHEHSGSYRIALFLAGAVSLTLYGTALNMAPVEFAQVTGIYIAILFVVFQATNFLFFRVMPDKSVCVGGVLIVAGGLIVGLWK